MRVLIVTGIFPPDHGGPASYVPKIAHELSKRHNVSSVITLSDFSYNSDDKKHNFNIFRIPRKKNKILRRVLSIYHIYRLAINSDIVYVNGLFFESFIAAKILARKPMVCKIVGDYVWETLSNRKEISDNIDNFQKSKLGVKWSIVRFLHRKTIQQFDKVITPSLYLKTIVAGWGVSSKKISVIYNSVKDTPVQKCIKKDYDVITVARLVPWKGIEDIIKVCAKNNWTLAIVGSGPLRKDLSMLAGQALNKSIFLLGHVRQDVVYQKISNSKVFVLNSSYEGLPHIILEAMISRTPVVATSVGGTKETIINGSDGYLITHGNTKELTLKISKLLHNPSLRDFFVDNAYKKVRKEFVFENMIIQTENLLMDQLTE
jgi:glycosyltransferase involved in cell wall biosynthesis